MARTAITPLAAVRNGGAAKTQANIDQANGMTIAAAVPEKTILRVSNTGTAGNAIVRAGNSGLYPSVLAGQGDITTNVAATTGVSYMGPFDSARVLQSDGSLSVDFAAGVAGTIEVLVLP